MNTPSWRDTNAWKIFALIVGCVVVATLLSHPHRFPETFVISALIGAWTFALVCYGFVKRLLRGWTLRFYVEWLCVYALPLAALRVLAGVWGYAGALTGMIVIIIAWYLRKHREARMIALAWAGVGLGLFFADYLPPMSAGLLAAGIFLYDSIFLQLKPEHTPWMLKGEGRDSVPIIDIRAGMGIPVSHVVLLSMSMALMSTLSPPLAPWLVALGVVVAIFRVFLYRITLLPLAWVALWLLGSYAVYVLQQRWW